MFFRAVVRPFRSLWLSGTRMWNSSDFWTLIPTRKPPLLKAKLKIRMEWKNRLFFTLKSLHLNMMSWSSWCKKAANNSKLISSTISIINASSKHDNIATVNKRLIDGFVIKWSFGFTSDINLTYIFPATPAHILKYSKKELALITETAETYKTVVKPYIEKNQLSPQWVYNILDGKSERDRTFFENDQFMLLLNYNWDGKAIESLYLLALVRDRDIHSIRDLKPAHIPMLESLLEKCIVRIRFFRF